MLYERYFLNQGDSPSLKIDWLPSYSELKVGLENYGFLLHSPVKASSDAEMDLGGNISSHVCNKLFSTQGLNEN